ncbi:Splicing factor 3B subunit 3 [Dirofilaria immitis]|nr:Splicing factor 3B subunit 3 [Dirofilaria immitis]
MYLYNLTLQGSSAINQAIHGSFCGLPKQQEVCIARGNLLQLLFCDPKTGKIHVLCSHNTFGIIRSLLAFRLTGGNKDYIVVGSDAGRIVILEYNAQKVCFERVHQETFGKTGCRRIVPGQFLAVDPKGRAILIGAVERQKLVYIMNRDASANLTISSPLEAHKSHCICYSVVGVDVGFENPTFACLEVDYEEVDHDPTGHLAAKIPQTLTFYELDLVPGGQDGPSGVIVCCENYLVYKNLGDQPDIKCPIPRRRNELDDCDRTVIIVCAATHKTKLMYFFLVQTDQGDIFKVTLESEHDIVTELKIKYFDTIAVSNAMCILKTGFLFTASEFGNHHLYQIAHLGDEDDEPEFSSRMQLEEGETFFLLLIDDLANEDSPQIYTLVGRGALSAVKVLRNGLEVTEMAVSELPGNPNAVWTVKRNIDDKFDSHIVVSFVNATLVLSIGETVEEVTDSGFLGTTPTLGCALIGDDALLQVYPDGIRHIRADRRVNEWKAPGKRTIMKCALNRRQVAIALAGGELVYFELDVTGQLNEYTERRELPADVLCMSLSEIPEGELRSRFLTVGLADKTVRIISLDPQDCLSPLSMQALPSEPESIIVLEMFGTEAQSASTVHLNIGLQNGCLLRTTVDQVTGELTDNRTRYLGTKSVKLFRVKIQNKDAIMAASSRAWLLYDYQSRFHLTPLSYAALEYAAGFSSEQCPEGIVAIAEKYFELGAVFNHVVHPLDYTPRRMLVHKASGNLIIIENDHAAFTVKGKMERRKQLADELMEVAKEAEEADQQAVKEMADAIRTEKVDERIYGSPKNQKGKWASTVRIMRSNDGETLSLFPFAEDEAAFAIAMVQFQNQSDTQFVLVGCGCELQLKPRKANGGCIYTFLLAANGTALQLLHRTPTDEVVNAIHDFRGMALAGVGKKCDYTILGRENCLLSAKTGAELTWPIQDDTDQTYGLTFKENPYNMLKKVCKYKLEFSQEIENVDKKQVFLLTDFCAEIIEAVFNLFNSPLNGDYN